MTSEREIWAALREELGADEMSPMMAAAIENARHGLPVHAVQPRDKRPLHKGWQRSATTKVEHLMRVWRRVPSANVGIACRDLVVLDADSQRGEDAVADLDLPATTTVRTARGMHFYFVGRGPTIPNLLNDVELRGRGSGVLGAGSMHPSGTDYAWEVAPWEVPPVPLPDELRRLITEHRGNTGATPNGESIRPGGRSVYLLKVAGSLKGRYGVGDVTPVLHAVNETTCLPPLPKSKVEKLARDAEKWPHPPLWITDPATYACADSRLSLAARVVLTILCRHADDRGECHPGMRRIAELAGIALRRVPQVIEELVAAERIVVLRRSRRYGNLYKLLDWRPNEGTYVLKGRTSVSHGGTPREDQR